MSSKTIIDIAVNKMLNVLGLKMFRQHIKRYIAFVSENESGTVRRFKDKDGQVMTISVHGLNCQDFVGVFPCQGHWTMFKDDSQATFDLFTKCIRKYFFDDKPSSSQISNPFFGCNTPEEVIVKCDFLMAK